MRRAAQGMRQGLHGQSRAHLAAQPYRKCAQMCRHDSLAHICMQASKHVQAQACTHADTHTQMCTHGGTREHAPNVGLACGRVRCGTGVYDDLSISHCSNRCWNQNALLSGKLRTRKDRESRKANTDTVEVRLVNSRTRTKGDLARLRAAGRM